MKYVALLRGINVGGKNRVDMAKLKVTFENLGFTGVKTYINSGNVIFDTNKTSKLNSMIEKAIEQDFGFFVPTITRSFTQLEQLIAKIPASWTNDQVMRTDVLFLWDEVDSPDVMKNFVYKPELEDVLYLPGAIVWRVDRVNVRRGSLPKIIGTDFYKKTTIRNVNTARKLHAMMQQ